MVPRHKDRARTDDRPMATASDSRLLKGIAHAVASLLLDARAACAGRVQPLRATDGERVRVELQPVPLPRRVTPSTRRGHLDCE